MLPTLFKTTIVIYLIQINYARIFLSLSGVLDLNIVLDRPQWTIRSPHIDIRWSGSFMVNYPFTNHWSFEPDSSRQQNCESTLYVSLSIIMTLFDACINLHKTHLLQTALDRFKNIDQFNTVESINSIRCSGVQLGEAWQKSRAHLWNRTGNDERHT